MKILKIGGGWGGGPAIWEKFPKKSLFFLDKPPNAACQSLFAFNATPWRNRPAVLSSPALGNFERRLVRKLQGKTWFSNKAVGFGNVPLFRGSITSAKPFLSQYLYYICYGLADKFSADIFPEDNFHPDRFPGRQIPPGQIPGSVFGRTNSRISVWADKFPLDKFPNQRWGWQIPG